MKYTVYSVKDDDNAILHCVWENDTEQLIKYFAFEEDAVEYARFLELGGGFDGFTPAFITNEIDMEKLVDINTIFSDNFS